MIGHYLMTLCPEAENDVLTGKMRPGNYGDEAVRCLVGWAADRTEEGHRPRRPWHNETRWSGSDPTTWEYVESLELRYDGLCGRFGVARMNAAIRNRILSNQARRALQGGGACRESAGVAS